MDDRTVRTQNDMLSALEDDLGLAVTQMEITEYVRGSPTDDDATVTGAEISLKVYLSLDDPNEDDTSKFRYDP